MKAREAETRIAADNLVTLRGGGELAGTRPAHKEHETGRRRPLTWVDLSSAYSKRSDLAEALVSAVSQLRGAQQGGDIPRVSVRSIGRIEREWRVRDRLGDDQLGQLVGAFRTGTPERKLAERYGISESSVKRVIRQMGASEPSRKLYLGQGRYHLGP